jgi:TetR/AcrR family transcriptional repressor of nem operon
MGRASRAEAEAHRVQVIEVASRLVRERGIEGTSVPDVMKAVGLTHGGFYRHFASKEDLLATACTEAFDEQLTRLADLLATSGPDSDTARRAFVEDYLSAGHRDNPGHGCATSALGADVSHLEPDSPVRESFQDGVRRSVEMLGRLGAHSEDQRERDREVMVEFATMVGALLIARATRGDEISDQVLAAARDHLLQ